MINAVLFDLDGTLLNRATSLLKFVEEQYDRLNHMFSHVEKETYIQRFIELDNRGYTWKDKVYQQLTNELDIKGISWEKLLKDYILGSNDYCIPFANLQEMLAALKNKGVQLGIITNGFGHLQMDKLRKLEIEEYFDIILVSEWEGIEKPNPEIFRKALTKLKVAPNEAMFVGDHPENDIWAAKQVGMIGVWKRDPYWETDKADFIIDDLSEILLLFDKLNNKLI